jgi:hypothetical protein
MALGPSKVPGEKAGPNGSFPVGDKKHARLAIGGATHSYNAGNISKSTEENIKGKARAKLGKTGTEHREKLMKTLAKHIKGGGKVEIHMHEHHHGHMHNEDHEHKLEDAAESNEHIERGFHRGGK